MVSGLEAAILNAGDDDLFPILGGVGVMSFGITLKAGMYNIAHVLGGSGGSTKLCLCEMILDIVSAACVVKAKPPSPIGEVLLHVVSNKKKGGKTIINPLATMVMNFNITCWC